MSTSSPCRWTALSSVRHRGRDPAGFPPSFPRHSPPAGRCWPPAAQDHCSSRAATREYSAGLGGVRGVLLLRVKVKPQHSGKSISS